MVLVVSVVLVCGAVYHSFVVSVVVSRVLHLGLVCLQLTFVDSLVSQELLEVTAERDSLHGEVHRLQVQLQQMESQVEEKEKLRLELVKITHERDELVQQHEATALSSGKELVDMQHKVTKLQELVAVLEDQSAATLSVDVKEQFEETVRQLSQSNAQVCTQQGEISSLRREIALLQEEKGAQALELRTQQKAHLCEVEELTQRLERLQGDLTSLQVEKSNLEQQVKEAMQENETLREAHAGQLQESGARMGEVESKSQSLQEMLEEERRLSDGLRQEKSALLSRLTLLEDQQAKLDKRLEESPSATQYTELQESSRFVAEERNRLQKDVAALQTQVVSLQAQIDSSEEKVQEEVEAQTEEEKHQKVGF